MAALFLVFMIFFNRYVVGTVGLLLKDSKEAYPLVMTSFYGVSPKGFFAFNIFVDLFLCTLVMFFMNARPTKIFTGKKILIFRAFTLLPIAYEVTSIILKGKDYVQLSGGALVVSIEAAMAKAETEYKKYKNRILSNVEKDYLQSMKLLEDFAARQ